METDKPFSRKSKKAQAKYFKLLDELYGRRPDNEERKEELEFQIESAGDEGRCGANLLCDVVNKK